MILQFFEEIKSFSDSANLSGEVRLPEKIDVRLKVHKGFLHFRQNLTQVTFVSL